MRSLIIEKKNNSQLYFHIIKSQESGVVAYGAILVFKKMFEKLWKSKFIHYNKDLKYEFYCISLHACFDRIKTYNHPKRNVEERCYRYFYTVMYFSIMK